MVRQCEFPEQITAADDIPKFIRTLLQTDELKLPSKPQRNLIELQEQRSFDIQLSPEPEAQNKTVVVGTDTYSGGEEKQNGNKTHNRVKKLKGETDADMTLEQQNEIPLLDSPFQTSRLGHTRSPPNEISFEHDLPHPKWFNEGPILNRFERSLLHALLKNNDSSLLSFCQGLSLANSSKEKLQAKLLRVYLSSAAEELFENTGIIKFVEKYQEVRSSKIFTALLKLHKFGKVTDFVAVVKKLYEARENRDCVKSSEKLIQSRTQQEINMSEEQIRYSQMVKEQNRNSFSIKLLDCGGSEKSVNMAQQQQHFSLPEMYANAIVLANKFHSTPIEGYFNENIGRDEELKHIENSKDGTILKEIKPMFKIPRSDFDETEEKHIQFLISQHDAFLIENFIEKPKLQSSTVKKYVRESATRLEVLELRIDEKDTKLKLQKFKIFQSLVYFLYKLRRVSRKQLKLFTYLYTWSHLSLLGAFELYLHTHCIEEFVDSVFLISYNFNSPTWDFNELSFEGELQLLTFLMFEKKFDSHSRHSYEKFLRAGDVAILQVLSDTSISNEEVPNRIQKLLEERSTLYEKFTESDVMQERMLKGLKEDRCKFIDAVVEAHFKEFTQSDLVKQCLMNDEPMIHAIFDVHDAQHDITEWIDSFCVYLKHIQLLHMQQVIKQSAEAAGINYQDVLNCRTDVVKGIYETHLVTNDLPDTIDSLTRAVKNNKCQGT